MIRLLRSPIFASISLLAVIAAFSAVEHRTELHAQQPVLVRNSLQPVSHATLAPTNAAAIGLVGVANAGPTGGTLTSPTGVGQVTRCFLTFESANARYWLDGTAPTTTVGHLAQPGLAFYLDSDIAIIGFKVIATTSTNAAIAVTCSR